MLTVCYKVNEGTGFVLTNNFQLKPDTIEQISLENINKNEIYQKHTRTESYKPVVNNSSSMFVRVCLCVCVCVCL